MKPTYKQIWLITYPILISLLISCFTFIPKIQAVFSKKPKEEAKKVPEKRYISIEG